jgi:hypothetical protein
MFSFISSIFYEQKLKKHFSLSKVPKIHIGLYDNSVKSIGIQLLDDKIVYKLNYYKNMDNGLLYMFEDDIQLRIMIENNCIMFQLFSVKHNIKYDHILNSQEIDYWKCYKFANHNNNINYCDLDYIFDFIEKNQ